MTNKEYSIALTVTYVPYIVAKLPSNLLLKASSSLFFSSYVIKFTWQTVGPSLMLPIMLTPWGVIATLQGWLLTGFRSVARLILPQHFGPQLRQQLALTITIYRQSNTSCAFKPAHWHLHHCTYDEAARTPGLFMLYFVLVGLSQLVVLRRASPHDSRYVSEKENFIQNHSLNHPT
jgi:hypothetical protein